MSKKSEWVINLTGNRKDGPVISGTFVLRRQEDFAEFLQGLEVSRGLSPKEPDEKAQVVMGSP